MDIISALTLLYKMAALLWGVYTDYQLFSYNQSPIAVKIILSYTIGSSNKGGNVPKLLMA